jgi:hypothetical protein
MINWKRPERSLHSPFEAIILEFAGRREITGYRNNEIQRHYIWYEVRA